MISVMGNMGVSGTGEQALALYPRQQSIYIYGNPCNTCAVTPVALLSALLSWLCRLFAVTGCSYIMYTNSTNCPGCVISIIISLMIINVKYSTFVYSIKLDCVCQKERKGEWGLVCNREWVDLFSMCTCTTSVTQNDVLQLVLYVFKPKKEACVTTLYKWWTLDNKIPSC